MSILGDIVSFVLIALFAGGVALAAVKLLGRWFFPLFIGGMLAAFVFAFLSSAKVDPALAVTIALVVGTSIVAGLEISARRHKQRLKQVAELELGPAFLAGDNEDEDALLFGQIDGFRLCISDYSYGDGADPDSPCYRIELDGAGRIPATLEIGPKDELEHLSPEARAPLTRLLEDLRASPHAENDVDDIRDWWSVKEGKLTFHLSHRVSTAQLMSFVRGLVVVAKSVTFELPAAS